MCKRYYGLNRILFKVFFFFSILIFIPLWATADENNAIGKVVALRGVVSVLDIDNQERQLKLKDAIFLAQTIETKNGRVQLMFKDNTLMTLGRNTTMIIQDYLWEMGNTNSKMKTFVKEGSFRVMGGAIAKDAPQNFKTETPAATIGIRGSMYAGLYEDNRLIVVFEGGQGIYVASGDNQVDIDIPGFGTEVSASDQIIKKPKKFGQEDLDKIDNALASNPESDDATEDPADSDSQSETIATNTSDDSTTGETSDDTNSGTSDSSENKTSEEGTDESEYSDSSFSDQDVIVNTTSGEQESNALGNSYTEISTLISEIASNFTETTIVDGLEDTSDEGIITSLLADLGYSGTQSSSVPSTGISYYKGKLKDHDGQIIDNDLTVAVNWFNGRLFAYENESVGQGYMSNGLGYGSVVADGTINDVVVLGTESSADIVTMSMSETFAQFYGSGPDALGIAMEGFDIEIQDQTQQTAIQEYLAATLESTGTNETGSETWNGFFVGVTEDMADPNNNRRIYINATNNTTYAAQDLNITVDKDNGRLNGTLNGTDFIDPSYNDLGSLTIGSSILDTSSVYISTKLAAAKLDGTNVIREGGSYGDLKEYGNFLVTSTDGSLESGNNTIWGYWELAYVGPESNRDYHTHVPGSLWIAGVQNTTSVTAGFAGTYSGLAKGVRFSDSSSMGDLEDGSINLSIDFDADTVSGNIDFTSAWGTHFVVGGISSVDNTGFTATITSINSGAIGVETDSHINGAFYGSSAESIGGNFSVKESGSSTRYEGIFAGN